MILRFVKTSALFLLLTIYLLIFPVSQAQAAVTILHNFIEATGISPSRSMILDDHKFYGIASGGGNNGLGVLYSVDTDGSNYTVLHHFVQATGASPGGITLFGSTIYGVANSGGNNDEGVIYSINTDGTGYTVLHHCAEATGRNPSAELLYVDGVLYGSTTSGGADNAGVIFSIESSGDGYTVLHEFDSETEGSGSTTELILDGTVLYGTTNFGASVADSGSLFSMEGDGSNFTVLHVFDKLNQGGQAQNQKLILDGTKIYGQTYNGGANDTGSIFSINTDGSGFTLLKSFNADTGLFRPTTPLYYDQATSTLYGGAQDGGEAENAMGGYFSIQTDGSNYTEFLVFGGDGEEGMTPKGIPIFIDDVLYGTLSSGGPNSNGYIFGNSEFSPSPSPTPSPNNNLSSSSTNHQAINSAPICSDSRPIGISDLFQINREGTRATLYFTPISERVNKYHVIFGYWEDDDRFGQIGAEVSQETNKGVQSIEINHLDPKASYWFKVVPVNGCASGEWSNWLEAKNITNNLAIFYRWFN